MRVSTVFRLLSGVAAVIAATIWFHERAVAAALRARLAALHNQEQELSTLRSERVRLREQFSAAQRQPNPRPAFAENVVLDRPAAPAASDAFAIGKWTPVAAWKNEGRSTPRSTISTLLWAAAGGDLSALRTVLEFDDSARIKARAWFEGLPSATRSLYATPEDLVASVTMSRIPPTTAELNWFHQTDADHAIVGIMLAGPRPSVPESAATIQPSVANEPPFLTSHSGNQLAVLNLVRSSDGWHVVVPVGVINRMANVLSPSAAAAH